MGGGEQELEMGSGKNEFVFVIEGGTETDDMMIHVERMFMFFGMTKFVEDHAVDRDWNFRDVGWVVVPTLWFSRGT